jgi:hypothetical protein
MGEDARGGKGNIPAGTSGYDLQIKVLFGSGNSLLNLGFWSARAAPHLVLPHEGEGAPESIGGLTKAISFAVR